MQLARQIMEGRLQKLGVSSPTVAVKGGNELVVQFAGAHDAARAASILGETGRLQFFDFEPSLAPPTVTGSQQPLPAASLYSLLKPVQKEAKGVAAGVLPLQDECPASDRAGTGSEPPSAAPAL
jgi:preprotein translocase subunit SecD